MKKIISFLLILALLSPCFIACGKKGEESKERSEPVELSKDNELILEIIKYVKTDVHYFRKIQLYEIINNYCAYDHRLLLADFSNSIQYFVCAYSEAKHDESKYCCIDEYNWVKYESADDIKDSYKGNDFVCAIQVNKASLVKDIMMPESATPDFYYYQMYETDFLFHINHNRPNDIDDSYIYRASLDAPTVYSSDEAYEKITCVNFLATTYLKCFVFEPDGECCTVYDDRINADSYYLHNLFPNSHKLPVNWEVKLYLVSIDDFIEVVKKHRDTV